MVIKTAKYSLGLKSRHATRIRKKRAIPTAVRRTKSRKDWHISASWGPNETPLQTPKTHHGNMVPTGSWGELYCSHPPPINIKVSQTSEIGLVLESFCSPKS